MQFFHLLPASIIAISTFFLLMLSLEMGFRWGKRLKIEGQVSHTLLALLAAVLGLLGLLLGFSFSMSATRFETRKELLAKEADAIYTTYLRGDLLEEPRRSQFKSLMRDYVDSRIGYFSENSLSEDKKKDRLWGEELQGKLWKLAMEEVSKNSQSTNNILLVGALNTMFDSGGERMAARKNQVPEPILLLLILSAIISGLLTGYCLGVSKERSFFPSFSFALIISLVLYTIIDIDEPRRGLVNISQEIMIQLRAGLK